MKYQRVYILIMIIMNALYVLIALIGDIVPQDLSSVIWRMILKLLLTNIVFIVIWPMYKKYPKLIIFTCLYLISSLMVPFSLYHYANIFDTTGEKSIWISVIVLIIAIVTLVYPVRLAMTHYLETQVAKPLIWLAFITLLVDSPLLILVFGPSAISFLTTSGYVFAIVPLITLVIKIVIFIQFFQLSHQSPRASINYAEKEQ